MDGPKDMKSARHSGALVSEGRHVLVRVSNSKTLGTIGGPASGKRISV
jgi:hypothetical protein